MRTHTCWTTRSLTWLITLAAACGGVANAGPDSGDRCAALAGSKLGQVEIRSATLQPAQVPVPNSKLPQMAATLPVGPDMAGLPAFCRVIGSVHPEAGSDIRFEVWMPAEGWDGRLNGGNSGGFAGYINYMDLAGAVRAGQAGVATDTGHSGTPTSGDWALGHPERVRDYGWRGVHLATVAGKQLVKKYYGRAASHSYFIGCSNGGRQALMEASRFPGDYDGIVAGAPASKFTNLVMSMINTVQAQSAAGARIRAPQLRLLQDEVLKQCDAVDGQADGLVADPRRCQVDVAKLACGVSDSPQCFSPPQIEALRRIGSGPRDSTGRAVAFGYPLSGAEVGNPVSFFGWEGWITGTATEPAYHTVYPTEIVAKFVTPPFGTVAGFDFDRDPARLHAAFAADLDARTDMRKFFRRGGKLIIWHGWSDAAISPLQSIDFHQQVLRDSGASAGNSVRLFLVPGVQHCAGGTGYGSIGQMSAPAPGDSPETSVGAAIQAWVEQGRVPESIIGGKGLSMSFGGGATTDSSQRRICAFPAEAVLQPGADVAKASSYVCRDPATAAR
jgi:Tannase and feruloyl esterase